MDLRLPSDQPFKHTPYQVFVTWEWKTHYTRLLPL
jgi:hypothetical protein